MLGTSHLLAAMAVALLTCAATYGFIALVRSRGWLAVPNARSSHKRLTPTSGGLPMIVIALLAWVVLDPPRDLATLAFLAGLASIATLSFIDDRRNVAWRVRLALQTLAVAVAVAALPASQRLFPDLVPLVLERLALAICWLWFVNLFNFMDGIDGLAGSEAVLICVGIVAAALTARLTGTPALLALLIAAAALGFLWHNWPPARIFMGDIGSVPLGFAIGWLLIQLALAGAPVPALILPLYFVADATVTLLKRMARAAPLAEAHRDHYYQAPIRAGATHLSVTLRVIGLDLLLVLCALLALERPAAALALAALLVAVFLWHLERMAAGAAARTT